MKAWHFVKGNKLRDGRPLPRDGELLVHDDPPVLCHRGLHASVRPLDALHYAPGPVVCRVEVGGEIVHASDKLAATERTILWRADAGDVLEKFARMCASDVLDLWNPPDVVSEYLKTGDPDLRHAAQGVAAMVARAARGAAEEAAWAVRAARGAAEAARERQNWRLYRMLMKLRTQKER